MIMILVTMYFTKLQMLILMAKNSILSVKTKSSIFGVGRELVEVVSGALSV